MSGRKDDRTIHEIMVEYVADLVSKFGVGYEITRAEIVQQVCNRYGLNPGSVIPSDYCYNRVNKTQNVRTMPALFEYVEGKSSRDTIYRCLGNYPYNGNVYRRPKGHPADIKVGICENGVRKIFPQYQSAFKF
ncbi:MAG: DUF7225 domain-containing protein [Acutalibacteraceae bacterium]|jgi:hypothetical protein